LVRSQFVYYNKTTTSNLREAGSFRGARLYVPEKKALKEVTTFSTYLTVGV